jgi:hypothetical protein
VHIKAQLCGGEVSIKMEDGTAYTVERVNRKDLANFIDALEIEYNSIAVEPISIKHKGELLGIADWEFNKPAEMIFRQNPSIQSQPAEDPLVQLKMRLIKGGKYLKKNTTLNFGCYKKNKRRQR